MFFYREEWVNWKNIKKVKNIRWFIKRARWIWTKSYILIGKFNQNKIRKSLCVRVILKSEKFNKPWILLKPAKLIKANIRFYITTDLVWKLIKINKRGTLRKY